MWWGIITQHLTNFRLINCMEVDQSFWSYLNSKNDHCSNYIALKHVKCYLLVQSPFEIPSGMLCVVLDGSQELKKYFYTFTPSFTHSYLYHWKAGTIKAKHELQKARWGRLLYCGKIFEYRTIKSIMLWQTCNITFVKWQDITMRNSHSSNTLGNV